MIIITVTTVLRSIASIILIVIIRNIFIMAMILITIKIFITVIKKEKNRVWETYVTYRRVAKTNLTPFRGLFDLGR